MNGQLVASMVLSICLMLTTSIIAEDQNAEKKTSSEKAKQQIESTERILFFTPSGPLLIEIELLVENQGYHKVWEKLFTKMLAGSDTNNDGKHTWEEALKNPRFAFGRFVQQSRNDAQIKSLIRSYDRNKDGIVDLEELARILGGNAFTLSNARSYQQNMTDLFALLDTDKNKILNAEELAKTEAKLKPFDQNDNDLIDQTELRRNPSSGASYRSHVRSSSNQAMHLTTEIKARQIFEQLHRHYKNKEGKVDQESFALLPSLFTEIDKDKNGFIEEKEVDAFREMPPHVGLQIHYGALGQQKMEMSLVSLHPDLGKQEEISQPQKDHLAIKLPKLTVDFHVQDSSRHYDFTSQANSMLSRFDGDNNGYLEEKELNGQNAKYYKQQFVVWDANEDKKVYPEEIKSWYEAQQTPQQHRIYANSSLIGRDLFSLIDQNGDQRIGLREMKYSSEQLKSLDQNQDQQLDQKEIPVKVRLGIGRAGYNYGNRVYRSPYALQQHQSLPKLTGPEWFTRMDRNRDGDLTLKEWLGTSQQFEKLDTNQDSFIELAEALAVTKKASATKQPMLDEPSQLEEDLQIEE